MPRATRSSRRAGAGAVLMSPSPQKMMRRKRRVRDSDSEEDPLMLGPARKAQRSRKKGAAVALTSTAADHAGESTAPLSSPRPEHREARVGPAVSTARKPPAKAASESGDKENSENQKQPQDAQPPQRSVALEQRDTGSSLEADALLQKQHQDLRQRYQRLAQMRTTEQEKLYKSLQAASEQRRRAAEDVMATLRAELAYLKQQGIPKEVKQQIQELHEERDALAERLAAAQEDLARMRQQQFQQQLADGSAGSEAATTSIGDNINEDLDELHHELALKMDGLTGRVEELEAENDASAALLRALHTTTGMTIRLLPHASKRYECTMAGGALRFTLNLSRTSDVGYRPLHVDPALKLEPFMLEAIVFSAKEAPRFMAKLMACVYLTAFDRA